MKYTVHVGPRSVEWPTQVSEHTTRSAAQEAAKLALRHSPEGVTKGEVRLNVCLLDCFSKRPSGSIRHIYSAIQRQREKE
jgi:hypothetical protein